MIDPQNPGVAHIGAQRLNEGRKALTPKHQWIDRRQAPILAAAAQRVWRRANRCSRRDQLLIGPSFCPVRVGADRQVPIESKRKPGFPASTRCSCKLPVGLPLQKLKELDAIAMRVCKGGNLRRSWIAHRHRPAMPRELSLLAKVVFV